MRYILLLLLISCSVKFESEHGIHYEFKSSRVEKKTTEIIKILETKITTELNVECTTYGYCCDYEGCGNYHDCDGKRSFVKYQYQRYLEQDTYKLKGGRSIKSKEVEKERETVVEQADCKLN